MSSQILLEVKELTKYFPITRGIVRRRKIADVKAVDKVSFYIRKGETLGLVGESGCGKTTLGRCILQLYRPTSGEVFFEGQDLTKMQGRELRSMRKRMQVIFQDPYSSLNPRLKCGSIVGEPLQTHTKIKGREYHSRIEQMLAEVGLDPKTSERFPHEFSGGQRQRIGIARAMVLNPSFVVCDEPVSALDVSIQAQIINLLTDLQAKHDLTYLFVAHDLSVVRHVSDRIAVMYLGKIVEIASKSGMYSNPLHPYTKGLLSAVPIPDPAIELKRKRTILSGDVPSPVNPPSGCNFHPRCPQAKKECDQEAPPLRLVSADGQDEHWLACCSP